MSETPSSFQIKPGEQAPDFLLPDAATGELVRLSEKRGPRGTLVVFVCNHCPYVVMLADALGRWADKALIKGVATFAVNSNDSAAYPDDAVEKMPGFARNHNWHFPYLRDESQETAKAFDAACTPDFFLLDAQGRLFYAGQFDKARPGNGQPVTGECLDAALEALIEGSPAPRPFLPATGCNIKWKPGNSPR